MSHTIFKNAMLLDAEGGALIGPCNVLVDGGLVEEGAQADLLVLDGNPIDDLTLLQHQGKHMLAIMKGGVFYKTELG